MIVEKLTEVVKFAPYYGAPYTAQVTLQYLAADWVNLKGLQGEFDKQMRRELVDYLRVQGVKKATFTRYRKGEWVTYTRPV